MSELATAEPLVFGGGTFAALSVGQLTRHIQQLLTTDEILSDVWVRGEIGSLGRPNSGHLYFALKDDESCVNCVCWRSRAGRLEFDLQDGQQVLVRGRVDLYPARGQYQLQVEEIQPDGVGAAYLALEQLKRRLLEEGLFDAERKQPLPLFPERVAIITSATGAAVHDMCSVLQRCERPVEIVLVPALVQGQEAPASLVEALALADEYSAADVIILGRGGGSAEDLWPFNSEAVVRAIAATRLPVISAVGHETDFTLADLAADERCPTPTAAAELLLQRRESWIDYLLGIPDQLRSALRLALERERQRLAFVAQRRALAEPLETVVERRRQRLDDLGARLGRAIERGLELRLQRLALLGGQMDSLSPLAVLNRGFARVVLAADGTPVRRVADLRPEETVRVALRDGSFEARVTTIHPEESTP